MSKPDYGTTRVRAIAQRGTVEIDECFVIAGEIIVFGTRLVRISHMSDGTICRDCRKRIAIRNVSTNRLSYVSEWQLLKAKRAQAPVGKLSRQATSETDNGSV